MSSFICIKRLENGLIFKYTVLCDISCLAMANKRLSKLQSSSLEPSELDLADEDVNELTVSGVLSLTTEENMQCLYPNGKGIYTIHCDILPTGGYV